MSPLVTPLGKRLASYSAAAGVALALAPEATAQLTYTDVDPDGVATQGAPFALDIDGDGTVDFQAFISAGADGGATASRALFLNAVDGATNGAFGVDAPYFENVIFGSAENLGEGAEIGADGEFFGAGVLGSIYNGNPYYNFIDGEGIVGFRFTAGGGTTHYGWARLAVDAASETITVREYAFEATPDTPIVAGNSVSTEPSALTDGYRFSAITPNPASGQARFEVAVGQSEDVRVEVFDALGRSQAVLHDGPMASGAAQTLTLQSATLPAGIYVVRVSGESFTSSRTLTVLR